MTDPKVSYGLLELLTKEAAIPYTPESLSQLDTWFQAYVNEMSREARGLVRVALGVLDFAAGQQPYNSSFAKLPLDTRKQIIQDLLSYPPQPLILSVLLRSAWLVVYSSSDAQQHLTFRAPTGGVTVSAPPQPDLDRRYDVCVIGSGAGGATVAALIKRAKPSAAVLLLESGPPMSPDKFPTADCEVLRQLYWNAGAQPAGTGEFLSFLPFLQARVLGGGPTVNNAIHFRMQQSTFDTDWNLDPLITFQAIADEYDLIEKELDVNVRWDNRSSGWRSAWFRDTATAQGETVGAFGLCVSDNCVGCGGCNCGCKYGAKIAGNHSVSPGPSKKSYLQEYRDLGGAIATNFSVDHLELNGNAAVAAYGTSPAGPKRILADRFVVAAGCVGSSRLLLRSGFRNKNIGRRLSANVILSVFATVPNVPLGPSSNPYSGLKDPGIEMCYYIERDTGKLLLETWFHFPGSLAASLPPDLTTIPQIMGRYTTLACCGVVVPSAADGSCSLSQISLPISTRDRDLFVEGIEQVADIYFKGDADAVYPGTTWPFTIHKATPASDLKLLRSKVRHARDLGLATSHPQGGNAIAASEESGVVNGDLKTFEAQNVWVADASVFPAGCGRNPQLTVMALARLAAKSIISTIA